MKKFTALLLAMLVFALVFTQSAFAGVVTTGTQESTAATTYEGYEGDMVRGQNIDMPIIICLVIVCACIVYGIAQLRKHKNDTL